MRTPAFQNTRTRQRCLAIALVVSSLILFTLTPIAYQFSEHGAEMWLDAGWITVSILAGVACFRAALASGPFGKRAWRHFGVGCFAWTIGAVIGTSFELFHVHVTNPNPADAAYLVSALLFISGMVHFMMQSVKSTRVHLANFAIALCSVFTAGYLFYIPYIDASGLSGYESVLAFIYPAIAASTAVFCMICFSMRTRSGALIPVLLFMGIFSQAVANGLYGYDMLSGNFFTHRPFGLVWAVSFLFVAWAALERLNCQREIEQTSVRYRRGREALVPAVSTGVILAALWFSGSGTVGFASGLLLPSLLLFAALIGVREHWVLQEESRLRRETEEASKLLAKSQERLSEVLSSTTDSVILLDKDWRVRFANQHAIDMVSPFCTFELGKALWELLPQAAGRKFAENYRLATERQVPVTFEDFWPDLGIWVEVHAFPGTDGLSIFFRDITNRRRAQEELARLAQYDPLTNVANRKLFAERMESVLNSGSPHSDLVLMVIDLDGFKAVNDTKGHLTGDIVLQQFAGRLTGLVRKEDTVARLGGDEFAIIQPGPMSLEEAAGVAQRIVAAMDTPFEVHGYELPLGASIGIATAPMHGGDAHDLVKNADLALYRAKLDKHSSYCVFERGMEEHVQSRQALIMDLHGAVERGELELAYQPIIELKNSRISSFEALLRWRHPVHGLLAPADFIPLAEDTGLIIPIGEWVFKQACADACTWPEDVSLAVNLSAAQLADGGLLEKVRSALLESGLEPGRLEFEVTESVLLHDSGGYLERLNDLRSLGIRIALDDFGTGYSSLGYLRSFPFDRIKIDRSFVGDLPDSTGSGAIVHAIMGLRTALGILTTAEGIETSGQLDLLLAEGCDEAQGFLFSRPIAARDIPALIEHKISLRDASNGAHSAAETHRAAVPPKQKVAADFAAVA